MKIIPTLVALTLFASPALAEYKYEEDRFTGIKTASYLQKEGGCEQTKGIQGKTEGCLFINSTENSKYPTIAVWKTNKGWELLHTAKRSGMAPAIITLTNGQVIRQSIPTKLTTRTGRGYVNEWVSLRLGGTNIPVSRIKTLEFQYGSAEFKVTPNKLAMCALTRAKTCS